MPLATRSPDAGEVSNVIAASGENGGGVRGTGTLGLYVFLGSLTMLFAGSMVGYLVIRVRAASWPPPGSPTLPGTLWLSTVVILASSVTAWLALRAIRGGRQSGLLAWLWATAVLGLAFLGLQAHNWIELAQRELTAKTNLYGFTFYMLTGLHAVHLIGGLIPLGIVLAKAHLGRYHWAQYAGVKHVGMYWHFLDAVWVVMFVALVVVG